MPVPVVVVGNVIAGGAGKTPVVIAVVRHLRRADCGGRGVARLRPPHRRLPSRWATRRPRRVGDEPLLVRADAVPVFVARGGAEAARALLQRASGHPGDRQRRRPAAPRAGTRRRDLRVRRARHRQRLAAARRPFARALAARRATWCCARRAAGIRGARGGAHLGDARGARRRHAHPAREPGRQGCTRWPASPIPNPSSPCCARRAARSSEPWRCPTITDFDDWAARPTRPPPCCAPRRTRPSCGAAPDAWAVPLRLEIAPSSGIPRCAAGARSYHRPMDHRCLNCSSAPSPRGRWTMTARSRNCCPAAPASPTHARRHSGAARERSPHAERRGTGSPASPHAPRLRRQVTSPC
jgi:hypothetical protein